MTSTVFEWDDAKAKSNLKKHQVSFDLAIEAFADPHAVLQQDRFEQGEHRWQTIGMVNNIMLLLVAHTVTDWRGVEVIRIISARQATRQEQRIYEQHYGENHC